LRVHDVKEALEIVELLKVGLLKAESINFPE
jgi:hypothetical protein